MLLPKPRAAALAARARGWPVGQILPGTHGFRRDAGPPGPAW